MYSIELAIIIPILTILVITALMMFQFATELSLFEIYHSREFMLSRSEVASLNGKVSTIEVRHVPYQVIRTLYFYNAHQVGLNAFEMITGKSTYAFNNKFYAVRNNRMALSCFKSGYDAFMNRER